MTTLQQQLRALGNIEYAKQLQRYFKTAPGEYGEGDVFIGIRVPALRSFASAHKDIPLTEAFELLRSKTHEDRMVALMILVRRMTSKDEEVRRTIYEAYLKSTAFINNWDLVDSSAEYIVGAWLRTRSRAPLKRLARSPSIWERRIAMLATAAYIKEGDFVDAFAIAELLIGDTHDLIQKAVGWMLREVGNRDGQAERAFLLKHYRSMPRTALRYAVEKFPEPERRRWLEGRIESWVDDQ